MIFKKNLTKIQPKKEFRISQNKT